MTLRVLPRLTLAVTQEAVRKKKRLVMLAPGLAAFAVYRLVKLVDPLVEPVTLLVLSGLVSAATALWAYRVGRAAPLRTLWKEDGARLVGWVVGWTGFAYGVQLSLMVLALLRVLVHYDFLRHPDGPAMMAIIIACTSVARDAFEIGHVRLLQRRGESVLTFPNGVPLRLLFRVHPGPLAQWSGLAVCGGMMLALGAARVSEAGRTELGQLVAVTLIGGCVALAAYLAGEQRPGGWRARLGTLGWSELFRFWWWPGLAFAATYYLVLVGAVVFLFRLEQTGGLAQGLIAGAVSGIMALYGYYLGYRRQVEDRVQQTVPASLLRCPFVMGILSKGGSPSGKPVVSSVDGVDGMARESGRRG
ncbi:MAG: hypothetical protein HY205_01685 [Nitrospirae bacterium]|nr:hypothetical protein [Nitrospirota bacterium]